MVSPAEIVSRGGSGSGLTRARVVALVVIGVLALGLGYLALAGESKLSVPDGAVAGDLVLEPCTYGTESGTLDAECGTLVVPENRSDPGSRLIALPVTRILATGADAAEPVFRLQGGPGITNMTFSEASRLTDRHDVVLVGYRGVDGSSVLECPEVVSALKSAGDFVAEGSLQRYSQAFGDCARRLTNDGVDLDGYSLPQRVDDLEAVRTALGYDRIDLVSESVGTRTAMIYAWRYPDSVYRSIMIGVNPPGRFAWDPETTDGQFAVYGELCAADADCASRTGDLVAAMRATSADMPGHWLWFPIKEGNVKVASLWGMFDTSDAAAPLNAPTTIDSWLSAANGDASGFWFMSFLADLAFPESFVWGEFAATGMADAAHVDAYYAAGGDPGSVLENEATDFLWGGGALTTAWPVSPDYAEYQQVRLSSVETLLVSGQLDFSTPPSLATDELLPSLTNGEQVILQGFGHSGDFWEFQPDASERLLTAFFDSGEVDDSLYVPQPVPFDVGAPSDPNIAKILAAMLIGFALAAILMLVWMARRVHTKNSFGRTGSTWLRALAPILLGVGGWFLALLVVMPLSPATPLDSTPVAVLSMGLAIGAGLFFAWVHRDWTAETRYRGLAAALTGSVVGGWFGFIAMPGLAAVGTTILGATIIGNLALIVHDIVIDRSPADDDTIVLELSPEDDSRLGTANDLDLRDEPSHVRG